MRIKLLRKQAGLTQEQLAKMVGVTQVYISQIERGDITGVTLGKLIKIAKILKITPIQLSTILLNKFNIIEPSNAIPKRKNLIKMAKFLNSTIDYLLSENAENDETFLSKFDKLSEKDRRKIIKMIELFEEEEP